jgi:hypothetical protein
LENARKKSLDEKMKLQAKQEKKRLDGFKMQEKMVQHKFKELQEKRELTKQRYQAE